MEVEPYKIAVPEEQLRDLKARLARPNYPDELADAGWELGSPVADVKRFAAYWREEFDWRAAEARMNETLPQFRTTIKVQGFEPVEVHFVHQRADTAAAIPLLFVHGWPGSFLEVSKLLPLLAQTADGTGPAFDVVAPSLPNFGFSGRVGARGFGLAQYAEVCDALMRRLGYEQYVTQGGDWGMMITRTMGLLYPQRVRASHINLFRPRGPSWISQPLLKLREQLAGLSSRDRAGLERGRWFERESQGYRVLQSTKPQTLGYALADSPVALLAWLWEKLHDWTDDHPWSPDEVLTWVSIYWFSTAGPAASLRIYYEATHPAARPDEIARLGRARFIHRDTTSQWIPRVKLGVARFPFELTVPPLLWAENLGPLVYSSENDRGGHFAATEQPEAIARDLKVMFGKGGGAYECVEGRSGYPERSRL